MSEEQEKTSYQKWYEKNRERLSKLRKERYQKDPEYRKKAIQSARRYRRKSFENRPDIPREYKLNSRDVAEQLGITTAMLRAWGDRGHYPTPFTARGRAYFTENQLTLLQRLAAFLDEHGPRIKRVDEQAFEELKELIYANWS